MVKLFSGNGGPERCARLLSVIASRVEHPDNTISMRSMSRLDIDSTFKNKFSWSFQSEFRVIP